MPDRRSELRSCCPSRVSSSAVSLGPCPGIGISLADQRQHELLHEPRLAVGGVLVEPQVTGLDAELGEAGRRQWRRPATPRRSTRRRPHRGPEQAELLELIIAPTSRPLAAASSPWERLAPARSAGALPPAPRSTAGGPVQISSTSSREPGTAVAPDPLGTLGVTASRRGGATRRARVGPREAATPRPRHRRLRRRPSPRGRPRCRGTPIRCPMPAVTPVAAPERSRWRPRCHAPAPRSRSRPRSTAASCVSPGAPVAPPPTPVAGAVPREHSPSRGPRRRRGAASVRSPAMSFCRRPRRRAMFPRGDGRPPGGRPLADQDALGDGGLIVGRIRPLGCADRFVVPVGP